MKILLHICCAPCAIYPLKVLRSEGFEVMGFFYNRNIHPFQECQRRENALKTYAEQVDLEVIYQDGYDMETFLQNVVFREEERCYYAPFFHVPYIGSIPLDTNQGNEMI